MVAVARALACVVFAVAVVAVVGPAKAATGDGATTTGKAVEARAILVFAAASLKDALDATAEGFTAGSGVPVTVSYAASSALARQIEAGAPADVFISADRDWMAYLAQRDLIEPATRRDLLGNGLVLIAPRTAPVELRIAPGFALATALGEGRLAMANTLAAPAGKYGRAALEALGVWAAVSDRIVQAESVRAALALVARGETPLGIVYRTDAAAEPDVVVVDTFPAETHPPIVYPVATIAGADHGGAAAFVSFLAGDEARRQFEAHGFSTLPQQAGY